MTLYKRNFKPRLMLQDIQALKGRSRLIGRLKYSLPSAAFFGLVLLICWPQAQKWFHSQKPALVESAALPQTNNSATHPEYKNSDKKNQPYTITADHGHESSPEEIDLTNPKLVMNLKSGELLTLTSNSGILNKVTNKMHLQGQVKLIHSQGYALETSQAWIDCQHGNAHGNHPVWGDGPAGAIKAKGFHIVEKGAKISFIGDTELHLIACGKNEQ
jgi:LPS export ABC transporter protein LptC